MTQATGRQPRHFHQLPGFWPAVVFLLTLATHGLYIAEMARHPFFNFPLVDSDAYHLQALDLLRHGWLGDKVFWQAPLYPYFLAVCYKLIDGVGRLFQFETHRVFDVRLLQALIAALNGVLLYELGRRRLGRAVGIGAAVAAAFYGPLIYFDAEMLAPVLVVLFYLLLALALDAALRGGAITWWPVAGVVNGLAALCHGMALFIAPLVCLYGLLRRRNGKREMRSAEGAVRNGGAQNESGPAPTAGRRVLAVALYALGVAATVLPATVRNRWVGGEWVLISHNGPVNFYIGNHPDYDRMVGLRPGLEWSSLARALDEQGIKTVGGETRHFVGATLANVRDHPFAVGRVWLKKIRLLFHADEIKRNYPIYPVREHSRLMAALLWKWRGPGGWIGLGFPFGLALPLAILGWWALRGQGTRLRAVELIVVGHLAANLLFFITSRYRVPLAPFLMLYAAAAVQWAARERLWQAHSLGRHWRVLSVAALVFLLSNAGLAPMGAPEDRAEYAFFHGFVAQHYKKRPDEAFAHYQEALLLQPDLTEARFFLGIIYQDNLRQPAKALEMFDWVLKRDPGNMSVMFNRALALDALGKREQARAILETLVANDPGNAKYRKYLGQLSEPKP